MTMRNASSKVFDEHQTQIRRARADKRIARKGSSFLLDRVLDDAADRILDVNRRFDKALIYGPKAIQDGIKARLMADKCPTQIHLNPNTQEDGMADLVISLLTLQSANDPLAVLSSYRSALKPDGLLLVAMFGGDSLSELRTALYAADQARFGGLTPRIFPFANHTQTAGLLSRAGLALPVVDTDRFTVNYAQLQTWVEDLRDIGATNTVSARDKRYVGKGFLRKTEAAHKRTEDGIRFPVQFEILWLTGWAPDASQQKPLKPGSAKMRLADALGTEEKKL